MQFLSRKEIPLKEIIPDDYVDIHSHLLSNIDDGVKTVYQSAFIIEQFEKLGVKKIITTPHVMQEMWPNSTETIQSKHIEMKEVLKSLNINVRLHASAEYMLDDLFYQRVKEKDIIPLHNRYILVEMSTFSPPINLNEILFETKLAGYTIILAHPERYSFYENHLEKYAQLKELGILFQLNLLSLSGYYGEMVKKTAIKLITEGYIDFTGSDVHNYQQFEVLEKGFSSKHTQKIVDIMNNNSIFC
ncbi:tyrosine-protein phosphatase [Aquimarina sp. RZ0]|uniref:tyrosine-protein phosphatase n=1 Tax=Aquimarina sp. RZ0 TaxID=2607730 RepID=UPI0011F2BCA4|nr:CpsB/CapC family capsule biosynthesis tyrosine phosphatase [Aquimarina sp. RZ0]KAA1246926.1 histidinol phosphatase [Aquimarina sp. RZ0]